MTPDIVNSLFEAGAVFATGLSVGKLLHDKKVAGIHWLQVGFFTVWGLWNIVYYPMLGQWWSFSAGVGLVLMNALYLILLLKYRGNT